MNVIPSEGYSITLRLRLENRPGMLGHVTSAIGDAGGNILDVFHRRGVGTDPAESIAKIVGRRRGGWCFELNGSFAHLLRELGYDAVNVSCRVHGDDGWGPDLDHCAIVVTIDGERWFVDVGFGDCCSVPVRLVPGDHRGIPRSVRLREHGERLDGFVGRFTQVPGGRDYLMRVPGVARSRLDDARLAAVLNWVLATYAVGEVASSFAPYTAAEVSLARRQVLLDRRSVREELLVERLRGDPIQELLIQPREAQLDGVLAEHRDQRLLLGEAAEGVLHHLEVVGQAARASYAYPGGLKLEIINPQ